MAVVEGYKVRPWPSSRTDSRDIFRIILSPSNLLMHRLSAGDVCHIETPAGSIKPAVAWPAAEKIKDDIVQISKALQRLYNLELGCRVLISRSNVLIIDASDVELCEVPKEEPEMTLPALDETGRYHWSWLLEHTLEKAEILAPNMILDSVEGKAESRTFKILSINSSTDLGLYRAHQGCKVQILVDNPEADHAEKKSLQTLVIPNGGIGGLGKQMKQLNDTIAMYSESCYRRPNMPAFFQPCQGGILLYGVRGTGKSTVLRKISEAAWHKVFHIDNAVFNLRAGESEATINRIFSDALRRQPSVIIIDSLDVFAESRDTQEPRRSEGVGHTLSRELQRLGNTRTLAIGAARRLSSIHQDLRGPGRFELEIELPIPDSTSRAEILKVITGLPKEKAHPTLDSVASRTHGFVGADLKKLIGQAVKIRAIRDKDSGLTHGESTEHVAPESLLEDMREDFENALLRVRPTAMQEVFVETPGVRWSDIGGQHSVKEELEEAIVWPMKYPEAMERHSLKPKKGLLLYGPPGCSKTMTAKAAATESGLNFITVRGPELMSMYVGESERAIREVFSKARAVSPSIVFFDEIDAIGATGESDQHGGVHTVTTLLNELDGFRELKGVFVLAATNKPESLDAALIRAGRLDTTLYVGLPDIAARREILNIRMRKMYLSDDININAVSEATEGFSGAEITSICQKASYVAVREEMETGEKRRVCQKHFKTALARVEKSITPDMIKKYENWAAGRQ